MKKNYDELEIPFFETSFLQESYLQLLEQMFLDEYPFILENIIPDESAQKAIIAHRNFGLVAMASKSQGTALFNLLDVALRVRRYKLMLFIFTPLLISSASTAFKNV